MKFLLSLILSCLILLNGAGALFAQAIAFPVNNTEIRQLSTPELINNFYQYKAAAALKNVNTYAARYNAVAFYSYPRIFWEDKINLAPYNKTGSLFTQSLQDTYEYLKAQPKPDADTAAQAVIAQIIKNPRRVNVAKSIPMPQAGDIWHNAFYLSSFYIQLGDFAAKVAAENKNYAAYKNYLAKGSDFMGQPYKNYDFTIAKANYKPAVFLQRRADIEAFLTQYTQRANTFIRRTLAPLQANNIKGADVKTYLNTHLTAEDLPSGVTRAQLVHSLTANIPAPQYFYEQAAKINPSFNTQLKAMGTVLVKTNKATWTDVGDMFSMLEYVSIGTLIERLSKYGKIPARDTVIEEIASTLAAEALNKSIAQIANDLFEFEKPFYYSYSSMGLAQQQIVKNWHAAATNSFFGDKMIAKIAADNILQSGKRAYQDNKLSAALSQRRIQENTLFYAKAVPIAADFAVGDAVFILAVPLFKKANLLANSLKSGLKFDAAALKNTKLFKMQSARDIRNTANVWEDIASIKRAETTGNLEHAVWQLNTADGQVKGYFKMGSHSEVMRTKQVDDIVTKHGLRQKYNLIEIEYPYVLADDINILPPAIRKKLLADFNKISPKVRDASARAVKPLVTSAVDTKGMTGRRLQIGAVEDPLAMLGNQKISKEEWAQIQGFYKDLNNNGFSHSDLWNNLHIYRKPDGQLKITLLDFEQVTWANKVSISDFIILDHLERILGLNHLKDVPFRTF